MPMQAVSAWGSDYKKKFEDAFKSALAGVDPTLKVWGDWTNFNAIGIEVAPPYKSTGLCKVTSFPIPSFSPMGTPVDSAIALASSWKAWYSDIKFSVPPPTPPFSLITSVIPSPVGIEVAYAALLSGLIAEFTIIPPDPLTAFDLKGVAFGTLFHTACVSAGVQIDGIAIPGSPPPPLSLPLIPVL